MASLHLVYNILLSVGVATLFCLGAVVSIPWIDYMFTRFRLNPFEYMMRYFTWCEKTQERWRAGSPK